MERDDDSKPLVIRACKTGNAKVLNAILKGGAKPFAEDAYGCNVLHWLFLLGEEAQSMARVLSKYRSCSSLVNKPSVKPQSVHRQWPLQLIGTPLSFAISVGSIAGVQALLTIGADPFARVYHEGVYPCDHRRNWTALHVAVKYHNTALLCCLRQGRFKNCETTALEEPLACALSSSSTAERKALHGVKEERSLIDILQALGPPSSLAVAASDSTTPLAQAICFNDYTVAAALLKTYPELASIPFPTGEGTVSSTYPIHLAAQVASHRDTPDTLEILKLLQKSAEDCLPMRDGQGRTCLHLAVEGLSILPATWLLQIRPELLEMVDHQGKTALFYCSTVACAKFLIDSGADVNHCGRDWRTPLHYFAEIGAGHLFELLCKRGANLDAVDLIQHTPMHIATMSGCREAVVALAAAGGSLNLGNKSGITPLHIAVRNRRNDLTEILMNHGADPWIETSDGLLPLHWAVKTDNLHACKLLLKSPGKGWIADHGGNTPLHISARHGGTQTTAFLAGIFSQEAQLNQTNLNGETALHVAAFYGRPGPARALLEAGADPNARRNDGTNALHAALQSSTKLHSDQEDRMALYNQFIKSGTSLLAADRMDNLPWDNAVRVLDLDAIFLILSMGQNDACRDLRFHPSRENRKGSLEDASHIIFKRAADQKDYRLLMLLLRENLIGGNIIALDHSKQEYRNSRHRNIAQHEAQVLYRLAKDALDTRQRYPLRVGERLQDPVFPERSDLPSRAQASLLTSLFRTMAPWRSREV